MKILLFSTLNPYPFWAGSENLWFDFVRDKRVSNTVSFTVMLADSPVTRNKTEFLKASGATVSFYKHFNVDFTRRNLYRVGDKIKNKSVRTLPWYNEIAKNKYNLVWFNVAALADLHELAYAVHLCKKTNTPYWLLLQHGYEDFFITSQQELDTVCEVALSAKRFIFIADRNQYSLERAIGQLLPNAFRTVNAIPASVIEKAASISKLQQRQNEKAKFFNLGRFSPRDKAQHLLLETLADNRWKQRNWQLNFIGVSGFGKHYLEMLVRYYNLSPEKIKIKAHTENVLEEMADNDVLLMPSLAEGTPFAMVEAMACGKPALGTPVGGIPELISNGETGWLTKTTAVADISNTLEQVWNDRERWAVMGQKARNFIAENYNQEKTFTPLRAALLEDMNR